MTRHRPELQVTCDVPRCPEPQARHGFCDRHWFALSIPMRSELNRAVGTDAYRGVLEQALRSAQDNEPERNQ